MISDHKDEVPESARVSFLGRRIGKKDSIVGADVVFAQLGLASAVPGAMLPISGHWRSPDGVYIRIVSALGARRGIVGRCVEFSKRTNHDLWLPMFWHGGIDDQDREERPFDPFIWEEENHRVGVDAGEQTAARCVAERPRLGIDLTTKFSLTLHPDGREWRTADNKLALRSQVWGEWIPDPENHALRSNENGQILWASPEWLDHALPELDRQLAYMVTLEKYKTRRSYQESSGARAVYVGTRPAGETIRFWFAKKSSATIS